LCKQPLNKEFIEAIKRLTDSAEKGKEKKKRLSDKQKSRKSEKMRKVCWVKMSRHHFQVVQ
jgi:hypothetical protein